MKMTPEMLAELESVTQFMFTHRDPELGPHSQDDARGLAILYMENKYCPLFLEQLFEQVMNTPLLPKLAQQLPYDRSAQLAEACVGFAEGSVTTLQVLASSAYRLRLIELAVLLVTKHKAPASLVFLHAKRDSNQMVTNQLLAYLTQAELECIL